MDIKFTHICGYKITNRAGAWCASGSVGVTAQDEAAARAIALEVVRASFRGRPAGKTFTITGCTESNGILTPADQ